MTTPMAASPTKNPKGGAGAPEIERCSITNVGSVAMKGAVIRLAGNAMISNVAISRKSSRFCRNAKIVVLEVQVKGCEYFCLLLRYSLNAVLAKFVTDNPVNARLQGALLFDLSTTVDSR